MKILAGDVGGTNVRLAIFEVRGDTIVSIADTTVPSREHGSLAGPVGDFLAEQGTTCELAAFGVAGPVRGGRARTTNLPWIVDADFLADRFGFADVTLLNDLEATAWGVGELDDSEVRVLQVGAPDAAGSQAVVAAGTGLGVAGLYWDGSSHRPFASEGGHAGFAPASEDERALLRHLEARHGRVSWERVVSGPGLVAIHELLSGDAGGHGTRAGDGGDSDPAAAIAAAALADPGGVEARSLRVFSSVYGAVAGDLALTLMATGGVWVAGGIARKILPVLERGDFVARFVAKGRMAEVVEAMPIRVVLADDVALRGAARCAAHRLPGDTSAWTATVS